VILEHLAEQQKESFACVSISPQLAIRSGEVHVGCWDLALLVFHTTLLALDGETANEKLLVFVATGLSI
jgi:hypothetical protein